tara:strand:+ start:30 stop:326 length:297 start_codon:yes stop_codon:yes gene_type:complete
MITKNEKPHYLAFVQNKESLAVALSIEWSLTNQWLGHTPKTALSHLGITVPSDIPDEWQYFDFTTLAKIKQHNMHRDIQILENLDADIDVLNYGESDD